MNQSIRWLLLALMMAASACQQSPGGRVQAPVPDLPYAAFSMDELQRRTFGYFWELAHPENFQVPDRYPTDNFSSIAATGFGLTACIVGVERGYVSRAAAAERVRNTLKTLWELPQGPETSGVSGYKGFFYHFLNTNDARRFKQVELSTIDTGLLMAGVLSVQSYFDAEDPVEAEIRSLAEELYLRVEWDWALNDKGRLSMGWHPEKGFIETDWHGYNEAMILLILAIASPTHPIPAESWDRWCDTYEWATFYGQEHINFAPLFGHQYSHMYIDFRGIADPYLIRKNHIDYFENSRRATRANYAYCVDNPSGFTGYGPLLWGLTACDGPAWDKRKWNGRRVEFREYSARGASALQVVDDGTIAPTAAGGSMPFAADVCLPALQHMWDTYYDRLVGKYGFRDAFNLSYTFCKGCEEGWFDKDYLGIDQGPILIMIENHRTELIWNVMKRNPHLRRGLIKAGFMDGWLQVMDI